MEPQREELLSALRDAEKFISVSLLNEPLSADAQAKRQQLQVRLRRLTKSSYQDEEQETYDDVREDDIQPPGGPKMTLEGVSRESTEDAVQQENYEDMSPENTTEEIYDDTIPEEEPTKEEIYDDTIPEEETSKEEIYDDTVPEEENEDYEIAAPLKPKDAEGDSKSVDSIDSRDRSATQQLECLAKPIKPEDVEDIILTGYLEKHRKKGIYFGSKWQKRFCVLRSFVLYYYSGANSPSQKGSIILPGYTVAPYNKSKSNKEIILTRGEDRPFIFMAKSKEEADKWMDAIRQAASTNKISNRQSEILEKLRLSGEGEEDTSSMNGSISMEETYDDVGQQSDIRNNKETDSQELYEAPDESAQESTPPQPMRPSKLPPPPADIPPDDGEEMYDDVGFEPPPQPQRPAKQMQPVPEIPADALEDGEELYDDVGVLPPSPQPERPAKLPEPEIQPSFEEDEELYDDVGVSPPPQPERPTENPKRPVSEIPPTTEEEEDFYDDVGVQATEVVESKPPITERTLPQVPPNESKPSPPLAPRIPLPPTPKEAPKPIIPPRKPPQEAQSNGVDLPPTPPSEENEIKKAPPPPPPEEEPEKQKIDYGSIYQALWDCKPDAEDELEFCRGDLLYIYEKPHSDWWIGSKYKPQGYTTRLIPTNFIIQAYDL